MFLAFKSDYVQDILTKLFKVYVNLLWDKLGQNC